MTNAFDPSDDALSRARRCWDSGEALEAGKLIFESLSPAARPQWAARVLSLAMERTGTTSASLTRTLWIANNPSEWGRAHAEFSVLREESLKLSRRWSFGLRGNRLLHVLAIAELVAKVTYNATSPLDEFDEDSGWWIASCLKDLAGLVDDDEFSSAAWSVLSLQQG